MPSALVAALAAPIREVQSMVGPGWSGDPATDPATVLGGVRDALADVSAATAGRGLWPARLVGRGSRRRGRLRRGHRRGR